MTVAYTTSWGLALAIFQRRVQDPELVLLAQHTDRELRDFLSNGSPRRSRPLDELLRANCDEFARHFGIHPQLMIDDPPTPPLATVDALGGAVGEALANVGKHAGAGRVVVYAGRNDPGGGVLVTVYDDGKGFDLAHVPGDRGMARSIRARIEDVGGRVEVRSAPGHGTEVRLWAP